MSYYMTWGYLGYRKQIPWYLFLGGELLINWGYRCLAAEVDDSKDQIVHVCWKAECNSWKRLQLWRGEATKAWRANDTHFGGAKQFTFLSDITTMFKRVLSCFLGKSYCWLRLRRKAHRADQCPLMPLREFKSWKLNYGHWGQSRAKGQMAPVHLSAGSTSQWIACLAC